MQLYSPTHTLYTHLVVASTNRPVPSLYHHLTQEARVSGGNHSLRFQRCVVAKKLSGAFGKQPSSPLLIKVVGLYAGASFAALHMYYDPADRILEP